MIPQTVQPIITKLRKGETVAMEVVHAYATVYCFVWGSDTDGDNQRVFFELPQMSGALVSCPFGVTPKSF